MPPALPSVTARLVNGAGLRDTVAKLRLILMPLEFAIIVATT
jgi:hypothetical protein